MLLSGEPGIGKSRLTAVLDERLQSEPHTRLRYFCSHRDEDSAFDPFISQLERAAGLRRDERLDKLEAVLALPSYSLSQDAPLIAALPSISTEGRYPTLDLTPQKVKEKLRFLASTREGPLSGRIRRSNVSVKGWANVHRWRVSALR